MLTCFIKHVGGKEEAISVGVGRREGRSALSVAQRRYRERTGDSQEAHEGAGNLQGQHLKAV